MVMEDLQNARDVFQCVYHRPAHLLQLEMKTVALLRLATFAQNLHQVCMEYCIVSVLLQYST